MAAITLYISEILEIQSRVLTGGVGQGDLSPHIKPSARAIDSLGVALSQHGEIARNIKTADGAVQLLPHGGSDAQSIMYLYLYADQTNGTYVTLSYTQGVTARTIQFSGTLLLDLTDTSAGMTASTVTLTAFGQDVNVRGYWAGV